MTSKVWGKVHSHFDITYKLLYASNNTELWMRQLSNLFFPKTAIYQEDCLCCYVIALHISEDVGFNLDYPFSMFLISLCIRVPRIALCKPHVWYFQIHLVLSSSHIIRRGLIRVTDKAWLITIHLISSAVWWKRVLISLVRTAAQISTSSLGSAQAKQASFCAPAYAAFGQRYDSV